MKQVLTVLSLLFVGIAFGQVKNDSIVNPKIEIFKVSLEVNSAQEVEEGFNISDIEDLMIDMGKDEMFEVELICKKWNASDVLKQHMNFRISGRPHEKNFWTKRLQKIKYQAINFYKTK